MKLRSLAVAVFAACLLGGCSTYESPKLEVADVKVGEKTPEGVVLVFTLSARNDNASNPLPLKKIDYTLVMDGREVFSGGRSPEATLRPLGAQSIRVPAVIRLADAGAPRGVHEYVLSGRLTYIEPGKIAEILFDAEVSQPTVGFESRGSVDFGP